MCIPPWYRAPVRITLDWLGCATFRLTLGETVVFLDAYMERVKTAPPVGLSPHDVERADFVLVGHSHFDHLAGAEIIAANTGARVIGSNESCRVMRECGVPGTQLLPSQGGERHRLAPDVTVRVFPSVHTCLYAHTPQDAAESCAGDTGMDEEQRAAKFAGGNMFTDAYARYPEWAPLATEHFRTATGSRRDGGPLVYLIETPQGSIFYQDSTGCWTGVLSNIRADVAILAAVGRPNCDGEPYQGSQAEFIAMEAGLVRPRTLILGHHDNWLGLPEFTPLDTEPIRRAVANAAPDTQLCELEYMDGTTLLS